MRRYLVMVRPSLLSMFLGVLFGMVNHGLARSALTVVVTVVFCVLMDWMFFLPLYRWWDRLTKM